MAQYIRKDALVVEIEEKIMQYEVAFNDPSFASYEACLIAKGKYRKLLDILQFINALEVQEVDLDKISRQYALNNSPWDDCVDEIQDAYKAGFELGLMAQKGE